MTDSEESSQQDGLKDDRPRLLLPKWPILFGLLCAGGIVAVRSNAETLGVDVVNVATLILALLIFVSLILGILRQTGLSRSWRLTLVALLLLPIAFAMFTVRLQGVDGRLAPILRWVWSKDSKSLVDAPVISQNKSLVDLRTVTGDDFPEFLGPQRRAAIPAVFLQRDWSDYPPELLWRRPIGAGWSAFSIVNGFAVTLEQRGPNEVIVCYRLADGEVMWAHSYAARHDTVLGGLGPRSTPTIHDGRVYTLGATGVLNCLDGGNGHVIWSVNILEVAGVDVEQELQSVCWGRAASPLVIADEDLVVVPLGGPAAGPCYSLAAFDQATGALRWRGGDQQIGYASPSLATLCGVQQIVIVNESSVSGHRIADGQTLWQSPWSGQSSGEANCSQAVVLPDNQVLLTNRRKSELLQLSLSSSGTFEVASLWLGQNKLKTKFTNVVVHDGYIYGLSDGILECLELATGKRQWKNRRGDFGHGQILRVGDLLLVQEETGDVVTVELNPEEFVETSRFAAFSEPERTWNNPALYGSLLLVRNASEAACYRLELRQPGEQ